MSEVTLREMSGREVTVQLSTGPVTVLPLDLNDLIDIEDHFGSLDKMEFKSLKDARFLFYLILRKTVTDLTEEGVGRLVAVTDMQNLSDLMMKVGLVDAADMAKNSKGRVTKA